MDISLNATIFSTIQVSILRGELHDMMAISKSIQFDGLCEGIHFCFIQFMYPYVDIPGSSYCEVDFGQYHIIFIDPDANETFISTATFPKKNGMSDSLSSLLVFIGTMCPAFTFVNGSNSGNASSRSLCVEMMYSLVVSHCFLAGLDVIVCGFLCCGPKYPFCNIDGRLSKIVDPVSNESTIDGQGSGF